MDTIKKLIAEAESLPKRGASYGKYRQTYTNLADAVEKAFPGCGGITGGALNWSGKLVALVKVAKELLATADLKAPLNVNTAVGAAYVCINDDVVADCAITIAGCASPADIARAKLFAMSPKILDSLVWISQQIETYGPPAGMGDIDISEWKAEVSEILESVDEGFLESV